MGVTVVDKPLYDKIMDPLGLYRWVIDVDHRATVISRSCAGNSAGRGGPRGRIGRADIAIPNSFRLLDAAGAVLYEGRTNAASLAGKGLATGFEPLQDIGNGAVHIEYLKNGEWRRAK